MRTSWDYAGQPRNRPPQVSDHRPLAEDAGLTVITYDETDDRHRRCAVFTDFLLEHADEAAAEVGADALLSACGAVLLVDADVAFTVGGEGFLVPASPPLS